ncbi:MAG: hypothetical protein ABIH89_05870 [Elusimicrobiota bacterium]
MPREIKEDVILELSRVENAKGNPVVLRIVSWNEGEAKIEKRSFWRNENDELRIGKNMGLNADDFQILLDKKDEIMSILSGNANTDTSGA